MKIGCFALVEPFTPMERQFELIRSLDIDYVDLTDNHDGASLGVEFGFAASVSLDSNPADFQIIKAIRLAADLGVPEVITTEGDPKTKFGHALSEKERLFTICEKLQSPIEWAEELGVKLLLEPHGIVTDSVKHMGDLLERLGHEKTVGICLDTGNSWLGGGEPLDYVKTFGKRIQHVHWKDMPESWLPQRGKIFGCGMAVIPLGDGVVGISAIVKALKKIGFSGTTTLEIAGAENVKLSARRLRAWAS